MDDLEELKRRKERLELERDIAKLEREARVKQSVDNSIERLGEKVNKAAVLGSGWHWIWVAPMGAFGALLLLVGIVDFPKKPENLFIGVPLIIPLLLKIFRKH